MTDRRLSANLRRLNDELEAYAQRFSGEAQADLESATRLAHSLPLSHATSLTNLNGIVTNGGELLSQTELKMRGLRPASEPEEPSEESILGTQDVVFTFAGPLRYPGKTCGFLFNANCETKAAVRPRASPFDTGGLVSHLKPNLDNDELREYHERHELPTPAYRNYLERRLTVLYLSPWDYITASKPVKDGLDPIVADDPRSWTFEVRFFETLELAGNLIGAFLPVDALWKKWLLPVVKDWRRSGVTVRTYSAPEDGLSWRELEQLSIDFTKEVV